jgi:hypothetical protein
MSAQYEWTMNFSQANALALDIGTAALLLLNQIAYRQGRNKRRDGRPRRWLSICRGYLAAAIHRSTRSMSRYIAALREAGLLQVYTGRHHNGSWNPNTYRLTSKGAAFLKALGRTAFFMAGRGPSMAHYSSTTGMKDLQPPARTRRPEKAPLVERVEELSAGAHAGITSHSAFHDFVTRLKRE